MQWIHLAAVYVVVCVVAAGGARGQGATCLSMPPTAALAGQSSTMSFGGTCGETYGVRFVAQRGDAVPVAQRPRHEVALADVQAEHVAVADYNDDGLPDIFLLCRGDQTLSVYDGVDVGAWAARKRVLANALSEAQWVEPVDLDGDGDIDVVWADETRVGFLRNVGGGEFGPLELIGAGLGEVNELKVVDLNDDTWLDVVVVAKVDDVVGWFSAQDDNAEAWSALRVVESGAARIDQPTGVDVGDFDEDGHPDIVVTSEGTGNVVVYVNNMPASEDFSAGTVVTTLTQARHVHVSHLNGNTDSHLDLIVADSGANTIKWLPGNGDGSFGTLGTIGDTGAPNYIRTGDVDGDGDIDVISCSLFSDTLVLHRQSGVHGGTWETPVSVDTVDGASGLVLADVIGSTALDIVVVAEPGAFLAVYEGDGTGGFGPRLTLTPRVAAGPQSIAIEDFDGDGTADLVIASREDDRILFLPNHDGTGSLGTVVEMASALDKPVRVFAVDLDGDLDMDIVSVASIDDEAYFHENDLDGSGQWLAPVTFSKSINNPQAIIAGLFTDDALPDVVTVSSADNNVDLFVNNGGAPSTWTRVPVDSAAGGPEDAVAADFTGANGPDLVVASRTANDIRFYANNGAGGFETAVTIDNDLTNVLRLDAGDINGDGAPDFVAVAEGNRGEIFAFLNVEGASSWEQVLLGHVDAASVPTVRLIDMDTDGDLDLVVGTLNTALDLRWFENALGDYGATEAFFYPAQPLLSVMDLGVVKVNALMAGDVDGDGDIDLAVAMDAHNRVVWTERRAAAPGGAGGAVHMLTPTAASAQAVLAVDINDDSHMDLVTTATDNDLLLLSLGLGGGRMGAATMLAPDTYGVPRGLDVGDIDGDGDLDIAVTFHGSEAAGWLPQLGINSGVFGNVRIVELEANSAYDVELADLDGDQALDFVVAAEGTNLIVVWLNENNGRGTFHSRLALTDSNRVRAVAVGEVTGDAHVDIVSASTTTDSINVHAGNGAGGFGPAVAINSAQNSPYDVHLADVTGDGLLDMFVCNNAGTTNQVRFLPNLGSSSFGDHVIYSGMKCRNIRTAYVDADALLDVVVPGTASDSLRWFRNTGSADMSARFVEGTTSPIYANDVAINGARSVALADFDGDGHTDIALAQLAGHALDIFYHDTSDPPDYLVRPRQGVLSGKHGIHMGLGHADVDGDGFEDIIFGNYGGGTVGYILTTENGLGEMRVVTHALDTVYTVSAGDVDGDGDMDLVTQSFSGKKVYWIEQLGDTHSGLWSDPHTIGTGYTQATVVRVADMDGDGDLDVVLAQQVPSPITVLVNSGGAASFSTTIPVASSGPSDLHDIVLADIDNDEDMDVVAAGKGGDVAWYENDGQTTPSFTEHPLSDNVPTARSLAVSDVDNDGDMDVIVTSETGDRVMWFEQTTARVFGATHRVNHACQGAFAVAAGDLDGDAVDDVVSTCLTNARVYVNMNDGTGAFGPDISVARHTNVEAVVLVDTDHDGDLDVVFAGKHRIGIVKSASMPLQKTSVTADVTANEASVQLMYPGVYALEISVDGGATYTRQTDASLTVAPRTCPNARSVQSESPNRVFCAPCPPPRVAYSSLSLECRYRIDTLVGLSALSHGDAPTGVLVDGIPDEALPGMVVVFSPHPDCSGDLHAAGLPTLNLAVGGSDVAPAFAGGEYRVCLDDSATQEGDFLEQTTLGTVTVGCPSPPCLPTPGAVTGISPATWSSTETPTITLTVDEGVYESGVGTLFALSTDPTCKVANVRSVSSAALTTFTLAASVGETGTFYVCMSYTGGDAYVRQAALDVDITAGLNDGGGATGDPHFWGFHGGVYDFAGEPDRVFNVLSHPTLQMNALFSHVENGVAGTYMSAIGLSLGNRTRIAFRREGNASIFPLHPDPRAPASSALLEGGGRATWSRYSLTVWWDVFKIQLRRYGLAEDMDDTTSAHLGYRLWIDEHKLREQGRMETFAPHGVHGVSWRAWSVAVPTGVQGEGVIEGVWEQYALPSGDLFGSDFAFNQYVASPCGEVGMPSDEHAVFDGQAM